MTATSRSDIANLVALLKASFPTYRPERGTAEIYFRLLADLPKELLEAAAIACVSEPGRAFPPSVGEIRGQAGELQARAEGVPSPLDAFNEVMDMPEDMTHSEVREPQHEGEKWVIVDTPLRFSHRLVEKVARGLGWPQHFPSDNWSVDFGLFTRAYQAELERAMRRAIEVPAVTDYVDGQTALLGAGGTPTNEALLTSEREDPEDDESPADE